MEQGEFDVLKTYLQQMDSRLRSIDICAVIQTILVAFILWRVW